MNPYEKTAEEMKRQSEGPKRFAKTAIGIGGALGVSSFLPILSRAAPFLSQYVPEDLAIKGLSKINPKFGNFIQEALKGGYDFQEIKDFIGNQVNESQKQSPKENRNIIQQYSPELHQFIDQEIKKGLKPIQVGALAQNDKRFSQVIKKITKDHKLPWSSILESVYGGQDQVQQTQQIETEQIQPQQNQGQGLDPQLMQLMQGIRSSIQNIRGR